MKWLRKALSTSVGKKFVMAITGLLLCGFLVVHLAGNVLMYVGPEAYNAYAQTLHSQEGLVKTAEAGLLALFLAHIGLAVRTSLENRAARKIGYAKQASKIEGRVQSSSADRWMLISGLIVLGFLVLHLVDFTFELRPDIEYEGKQPFAKSMEILQNPLSAVVYLVGCVVLGFHLGHGVSSAFQSLGVNHPKYNLMIKWFGIVFAVVIAFGFATFPVLMYNLKL